MALPVPHFAASKAALEMRGDNCIFSKVWQLLRNFHPGGRGSGLATGVRACGNSTT
jgi:hypothetical protein